MIARAALIVPKFFHEWINRWIKAAAISQGWLNRAHRAEREHAGRFIVRADERLTAFLELELAIGPTPSVNFLSGKEMINEQLFPPRLFGYTFWAMQKGVELRIITRRAHPRSQVAGRGRQRMSVATVALG
jgi:hypothetical protein